MKIPLIEANFLVALSDRLSVLSVSDGVEGLLGFSPADFLSSWVSLNDRIHPHDSDIADLLFSTDTTKRSGEFNIRLRHADGGIRCIKGRYSKKSDRKGAVILNLLLQDAKSLWKKLDDQPMTANFKAMMENSDDFIFFKDRNHVFTAANQSVVTGVDPAMRDPSLIGKTDYDVLPEESADIYYRLEKQVYAGMSVANEVHEAQTMDGRIAWLDNHKFPIKNEEGEIIGLVGVVRDISDLMKAQQTLRESEESLKEAQRIAGIGSYITDLNAGMWTSSDVLDQLFGIDKEFERSVEGWISLIHPDDRAMMVTHFVDEVLGRRESFDKVYRIIRQSDGAVRWVHGLGQLDFGSDGRPIKMHGTIQDITSGKLSEAALRENKELLQLFIEHAPAALTMYDREMRVLAASRRWLENNSLTEREIVGHSYYEIFEEIPEHWKDALRRGLAGEAQRADEQLFELSDGSSQWIRWEILPWLSGDGAVGGIIVFSEDITREKQTTERLQLAASVFTHAREGILITAADGAILDVNDSFTRITGYTREEALGSNPRMLNSGIHGKEFYAEMWQTLKEKGQWSGEVWNRKKCGDLFPEMLTISAVYDAGGNIREYVALFSDITLLKEHERKLEHIAHYDALTGLPNRVLLADRLQQAMAQTHRRKQLLAVAYLDMDGFKVVNDRHGHDAGDLLLTSLASRMKLALREGDTLARLGGDEFVAVLLDLDDVASSVPVLSRLLQAAAEPAHIGDFAVQVSASVGVTFFPQPEAVDADQLLRQADQAMYQAKVAGRNRYHIFDPGQDISIRGRYKNVEHIRQALAARQFVLYYQPKVNMRTGKVVGAEALIRWLHPERGILLPAMFLPVIEDHPLAIELGEWVIETALAQMESWQASGLNIPVSVNVGALQLQQENFSRRLQTMVAAHPLIEPFNLELEVLETSALQDVVQVSKVFEACREIGVMFALDDFGTGYSSLTYLKRLPAHVLKIDQSFVSGMLEDAENLSILEGVLGLAIAFRRQVIAEGVESVEHGLMLLQLGCELAQGYGIAHPMPAENFPAWMASWRPDPCWSGVEPITPDDRPLLYAGVEHRAWMTSIEAWLCDEGTKAPPLNNQCRLGEWLAAKKVSARGSLPSFYATEALHVQVHALAAHLFDLNTQGRKTEAIACLHEIHELGNVLLEELKTLRDTG